MFKLLKVKTKILDVSRLTEDQSQGHQFSNLSEIFMWSINGSINGLKVKIQNNSKVITFTRNHTDNHDADNNRSKHNMSLHPPPQQKGHNSLFFTHFSYIHLACSTVTVDRLVMPKMREELEIHSFK